LFDSRYTLNCSEPADSR